MFSLLKVGAGKYIIGLECVHTASNVFALYSIFSDVYPLRLIVCNYWKSLRCNLQRERARERTFEGVSLKSNQREIPGEV